MRTRFIDVFWSQSRLPPGRQQEANRLGFLNAVGDSSMNLWGELLPAPSGPHLIIGAASYSQYDMLMLDLVEQYFDSRPDTKLRVDVFNTLDCLAQADFKECVPGLNGFVSQTPVVGYYPNTVASDEFDTGAAGRTLVGRVCDFDPSLTVPVRHT